MKKSKKLKTDPKLFVKLGRELVPLKHAAVLISNIVEKGAFSPQAAVVGGCRNTPLGIANLLQVQLFDIVSDKQFTDHYTSLWLKTRFATDGLSDKMLPAVLANLIAYEVYCEVPEFKTLVNKHTDTVPQIDPIMAMKVSMVVHQICRYLPQEYRKPVEQLLGTPETLPPGATIAVADPDHVYNWLTSRLHVRGINRELDLTIDLNGFATLGYSGDRFLVNFLHYSVLLVETCCYACIGLYNEHLKRRDALDQLIPEDEWYPDRSWKNRKEPTFDNVPETELCIPSSNSEPNYDMIPECDDSCGCARLPEEPEVPLVAENPTVNNINIVVVQELPNKEKLVRVRKSNGKIHYIVVGEDVDVARLPKIYNMMLRDELKMGVNVTTDRLTRIIKFQDMSEMGFTRKEIAEYCEVARHIVDSDLQLLKKIELLDRQEA